MINKLKKGLGLTKTSAGTFFLKEDKRLRYDLDIGRDFHFDVSKGLEFNQDIGKELEEQHLGLICLRLLGASSRQPWSIAGNRQTSAVFNTFQMQSNLLMPLPSPLPPASSS